MHTETIFSPRFCNTSPLAEIYYRPARDPSDSLMGTHGAISDGAMDSAAPLSMTTSMLTHSGCPRNMAPRLQQRTRRKSPPSISFSPADPNTPPSEQPQKVPLQLTTLPCRVSLARYTKDDLPPVVMEH